MTADSPEIFFSIDGAPPTSRATTRTTRMARRVYGNSSNIRTIPWLSKFRDVEEAISDRKNFPE